MQKCLIIQDSDTSYGTCKLPSVFVPTLPIFADPTILLTNFAEELVHLENSYNSTVGIVCTYCFQ